MLREDFLNSLKINLLSLLAFPLLVLAFAVKFTEKFLEYFLMLFRAILLLAFVFIIKYPFATNDLGFGKQPLHYSIIMAIITVLLIIIVFSLAAKFSELILSILQLISSLIGLLSEPLFDLYCNIYEKCDRLRSEQNLTKASGFLDFVFQILRAVNFITMKLFTHAKVFAALLSLAYLGLLIYLPFQFMNAVYYVDISEYFTAFHWVSVTIDILLYLFLFAAGANLFLSLAEDFKSCGDQLQKSANAVRDEKIYSAKVVAYAKK